MQPSRFLVVVQNDHLFSSELFIDGAGDWLLAWDSFNLTLGSSPPLSVTDDFDRSLAVGLRSVRLPFSEKQQRIHSQNVVLGDSSTTVACGTPLWLLHSMQQGLLDVSLRNSVL